MLHVCTCESAPLTHPVNVQVEPHVPQVFVFVFVWFGCFPFPLLFIGSYATGILAWGQMGLWLWVYRPAPATSLTANCP
jgi:hypothetical protein